MVVTSLVFHLIVTSTAFALPDHQRDTLRLSVGSREVDGRLYKPHAARVRVWIDSDSSRPRAEWVNVLRLGDSAGRPVMRWVTTGTRVAPNGDTVRWELRQTYDAQTLAPYRIDRTASTGAESSLRIEGRRVVGTRRMSRDAQPEPVEIELDRPGFPASASDLVPAAVGFRQGLVIVAPFWGPGMTKSEMRIFHVLGKTDVNVEGTTVNAWKVEERRESDNRLLATWWLTETSPYMVYGEVPLADGRVQRMSEVEVPMPER
jgi:hypothetical protein